MCCVQINTGDNSVVAKQDVLFGSTPGSTFSLKTVQHVRAWIKPPNSIMSIQALKCKDERLGEIAASLIKGSSLCEGVQDNSQCAFQQENIQSQGLNFCYMCHERQTTVKKNKK